MNGACDDERWRAEPRARPRAAAAAAARAAARRASSGSRRPRSRRSRRRRRRAAGRRARRRARPRPPRARAAPRSPFAATSRAPRVERVRDDAAEHAAAKSSSTSSSSAGWSPEPARGRRPRSTSPRSPFAPDGLRTTRGTAAELPPRSDANSDAISSSGSATSCAASAAPSPSRRVSGDASHDRRRIDTGGGDPSNAPRAVGRRERPRGIEQSQRTASDGSITAHTQHQTAASRHQSASITASTTLASRRSSRSRHGGKSKPLRARDVSRRKPLAGAVS